MLTLIFVVAIQRTGVTRQPAPAQRVCSPLQRAVAWWPCSIQMRLKSSSSIITPLCCRDRFLANRIWCTRWIFSEIPRPDRRRSVMSPSSSQNKMSMQTALCFFAWFSVCCSCFVCSPVSPRTRLSSLQSGVQLGTQGSFCLKVFQRLHHPLVTTSCLVAEVGSQECLQIELAQR